MNLIEQFGYEAVKAELKDKKWRKDNLHGSAEFTWHMKQHIQLLESALLEHRRQYNIFEIGDWIVNTKTGAFGDFIKYTDTKIGHKHCFVDIGLCDAALFCVKNIRHATDTEIKAGHRL